MARYEAICHCEASEAIPVSVIARLPKQSQYLSLRAQSEAIPVSVIAICHGEVQSHLSWRGTKPSKILYTIFLQRFSRNNIPSNLLNLFSIRS